MGNSVLSDVQSASYRGVDFNAQVVEWFDSREYRYAMHEYLKRDGGEAEQMGRKPHRVKFNLIYLGPNWRNDHQILQKEIDANPIGLLVHPFLGNMNVQVVSIGETKVNVENGINTVMIPISFIESNVSSAQQYSVVEGPSSKSQRVTSYVSKLNQATSIYATASSAVSVFGSTALSYGAAAVNAVTSASALTSANAPGGVPDFSLPTLLSQVVTNATAARTAIRSDPSFSSDAWDFGALVAIELVVDACAQLDESIRSSRPQLVQYTVPAMTTLLAISQALYGGDAASRLDEIRVNNPGKIPNPAAVQAGTVLLLAPTTIVELRA